MKNGNFPWDFSGSGQGYMEIHINQECVAIPMERYEKLIKAETQLEVAQSVYASADSSFDVDGLLKPIFGEQARHMKDGAKC